MEIRFIQHKNWNAGQAITMLFVTVIMAVMSGALATMPEIAKERAIFHRERSAGLGVLPYILSKLHLALMLALYQSLVLLICMVLAVNIPQVNNILIGMYCSLFLASFGSMVLGLLVSTISPSQSVAPLLTIVVLVPQVVFGGGILPVNEFHTVGQAINQVMLTKYPFETLVSMTELGADVADDPCWQKTKQKNKTLSKVELAKCNCYEQEVFNKCEFPGIGKVKKTLSLNADLLKVRLLIQGIFDSYGDIFSVNVYESWLSMLKIIGGMTLILFLCQFIKG
ncbi:ABC transporter permease [Nostoc sp. CMAA1605]|uniref:ABC transporter permease n=2 Tax=Nostoc sp. CMAA1605 TaxID=2055159 RepID=UPI001F333192|nr:ABC transporter permease [Nostoc sp. CMAA1605]